jgi:hypothetical protein
MALVITAQASNFMQGEHEAIANHRRQVRPDIPLRNALFSGFFLYDCQEQETTGKIDEESRKEAAMNNGW